jgi:hypothetical protein
MQNGSSEEESEEGPGQEEGREEENDPEDGRREKDDGEEDRYGSQGQAQGCEEEEVALGDSFSRGARSQTSRLFAF